MTTSYLDFPSAGLFKRLASMVYDLLILVAMWLLIGFLYMQLYQVITGVPANTEDPHYKQLLPFTLLPLLLMGTFTFYSWFWLHGGQTLGMRAWRLQVVDAHLDGRSVNLLQCLSRFLMALISLSTFGLGYLWVLVSPSGDTWHDSLSGTRTLLLPKEENKKVAPYRRRR
ncbi:MAG: RDD family protein [Gammaproteobacteria bacterium]|nr:RDD family protein [Gammaproteobacteria bacterium]